MRNHLLLTIAFLLAATIAGAQNLVLNPGFETITGGCAFSGYGSMSNWYLTDNCSSPDRFATCFLLPLLGAPSNGQGNQAPRNGQAYAGFITYDPSSSGTYREYVEGQLSTPLVAGQQYCVSFFISLADNSPYAVKPIGIYFSNTLVQYNITVDCVGASTLLNNTPQLVNTGSVLSDKTNWVELKWSYTATGGEQYFVIGNFSNDANSSVTGTGGGLQPFAYYYIDDVSVTPGICSAVSAAAAPTSSSCGQCNGSATANATGTGPFTYAWSNGETTQTISNLCANTYTVTVTDGSSNTAVASTTINSSTGITANATATAASCGNNNGSATAAVTAGTGPFTYSWSNGGSGATLNNLAPGNYTVTVSGAGGCTATTSASVTAGTGLTLSATATNASCGLNNGSADVSVTAGSGPYTYAWSNGGNTATISNLPAGNYTVTVTGAGGCTAAGSASVTSTAGLTLAASSTNATCGNSNGSATVSVNAGTGPYTYSWSNGGNAASISNLGAGNYSVTVTGAGGCSAIAGTTVTASAGLSITATATGANCGNADGSATVNVTAGTGPYTYNWSNGGNTATISSIGSGNYSVTVTGAGGCSAIANTTVTASGGVSLNPSAVGTTCGNSNGSATAAPVTGTAPYTYNWSNGGSSQTISNVSGGSYIVTVTDNNGCSTSATLQVGVSSALSTGFTVLQPSCGQSNGSITVGNIQNATGNVSITWSQGGTQLGTGNQISNLGAGTFTFSATDGAGCSLDSSFTFVSGGTSVSITQNEDTICVGDSVQICAPSGFQSYQWNSGETTMCIYAKLAGNYYVTVTDAGNCTVASNHLPVYVRPLPPVSITVTGDTLSSYNAVTYQWLLDGAPISGATNPNYVAQQSGGYQVLITDANGCRAMSNRINIAVLGIGTIALEGVKVYPNPTVEGWMVETGPDMLGGNLVVYDYRGRVVYTTAIRELKTAVNFNAAQGVYVLHLVVGNKVTELKLVKL